MLQAAIDVLRTLKLKGNSILYSWMVLKSAFVKITMTAQTVAMQLSIDFLWSEEIYRAHI